MHAVLIAKAASLPAWMQLLHVLATVVAKSKLLVLPIYPAAWPQAKKHPFVQAMFQFYRYVASLHLMQKTGYRYRQTDHALRGDGRWARDARPRASASATCPMPCLPCSTASVTRIGNASRAATMQAVEGLSRVPLIGSIVTSYAAHYAAAEQQPCGDGSAKRQAGSSSGGRSNFRPSTTKPRKTPKLPGTTRRRGSGPINPRHWAGRAPHLIVAAIVQASASCAT